MKIHLKSPTMHIHDVHPAHNQSIDQHIRQHDAAVEAIIAIINVNVNINVVPPQYKNHMTHDKIKCAQSIASSPVKVPTA